METKNSDSMKAIVLCGGKGTRLGNYSRVLPKPLMPVGDKPILEIVLHQIGNAGISDVTLSVGHLSHLIQSYFGDGRDFNLNLTYSKEEIPLGTSGPLSLVDGLDDTFLVTNGDLLSDLDIRKLIKYHQESNAIATIASYDRIVDIDLGVMKIDENNQVLNFVEKPKYSFQVSSGYYVFEPRVLDFLPKNQHYDFPELIFDLLKSKEKVVAYPFDGYWRDLGRPADYEEANKFFEENRSKFIT